MNTKIFDATFLRFFIVGGLGLLLNLVLFFLLADVLVLNPNWAAIITFAICVTHNYLLNHIWSFKYQVHSLPNIRKYFKFVLIYCCGLVVNLAVLNLILILFHPTLKVIADFFAAISSVFINFLGSKFFVFAEKPPKNSEL